MLAETTGTDSGTYVKFLLMARIWGSSQVLIVPCHMPAATGALNRKVLFSYPADSTVSQQTPVYSGSDNSQVSFSAPGTQVVGKGVPGML